MLRNNNSYVPLMHSNQNTFDIEVQPHVPQNMKGTMIMCVGSRKNPKAHAVEFKPGAHVNPAHFSFNYTDADRSSIVVSLYNRKSFFSEDVKIGHVDIPISEFDPNAPDTKELQLQGTGSKVVLQAMRTESF